MMQLAAYDLPLPLTSDVAFSVIFASRLIASLR